MLSGIKCPVCSKFVLSDDIECHIVMCLTKPRLSYNGSYFKYLRPRSSTLKYGTPLGPCPLCVAQGLFSNENLSSPVQQRMCSQMIKENVSFVWRTYYKAIP